jgi:hypothetical protein
LSRPRANFNTEGPSKEQWEQLEQQYSSVVREIDGSMSRIERALSTAKRTPRFDVDDILQLQSMLALSSKPAGSSPKSPGQLEEVAKLPCFIPPPFRIPRFFNRTDVLAKMEGFFGEKTTDNSFRSLVLYGLGGVGKSSVALRYAENRLRNGELDAMFWVPSEKAVTIRQAFTEIALRLKLPDARPTDHEENYAIVFNWLQHTSQ